MGTQPQPHPLATNTRDDHFAGPTALQPQPMRYGFDYDTSKPQPFTATRLGRLFKATFRYIVPGLGSTVDVPQANAPTEKPTLNGKRTAAVVALLYELENIVLSDGNDEVNAGHAGQGIGFDMIEQDVRQVGSWVEDGPLD